MLNGHLLNERYKIKQMIGGGGMANVYLARDVILDRDVAIKVLRLEYGNDDEFIARFHREAQSATSLSHPNIVNIYDVGEEDGIYFMAMEYVDGMTLKKHIQTYGPLEVQEALDIMKQITSAITHAHANDIVHRDIKPQNILIDPYGQVKVTDFGIAVALSATSLTQTNSVLGSVHYLSPEQARGGMANKKSDIYSLGIVLFELLTGRLPFSGESAVSIALKHLQSDTPSIRRWRPNIPQSVENIVLQSTTKDPFHRYETVYEMEDDLDTALDPSRENENIFTVPEDSGETTKAIPIITNDAFSNESNQDTIVHDTNNDTTKNIGDKKKGKKDKKNKKDKKKRKKAVLWIIIILFVLLGSIAAALFVLPNMFQPDDVEITDVVGMEYEKALSELSALNLSVEREDMYSEDIPEGQVIKTDPEVGMTVKEGSSVTVYSSQGKEKVTFEDYVGQDYTQVERVLSEKGYKDIIAYQQFSEQPVGQIINQVQPQAETEVVPEETNVIFEVSKGSPVVTLEDLTGMTEEEAKNYLDGQNLSANVTKENSDEVAVGEIIRHNPEAGTEVEEESIVDIYISKGPKADPPVSHSVTFTVPYTGEQSEGKQTGQEQPGQKQTVKIYVDDMENDITELFKKETITQDKEFTVKLTIAPEEEAVYKVMRDDEVVIERTVPYEDGE